MGFNSADDLYNAIGYGGLMMPKLLHRLQEECERAIKPEVEETLPQIKDSEQIINSAITKPRHVKSNSCIIVDGEAGCMVKFAKCCNPLPGDSVIGFVTKGFGISIHKLDCPNVIQGRNNPENADRWKEAHWEVSQEKGTSNSIYEALLQIYVDDRIGMLADVTAVLAEMRVSILQINVTNRNDGSAIINLKVGCRNIDHINSIVSRLRGLSGVDNILRGFA
jgi:GTP pyrophosphokinase